MRLKFIYLTIGLLLFCSAINAQVNYNSLYNLNKKDTAYILALLAVGKEIEEVSMDSAFLFYKKAFELSNAIKFKEGIYTYYHHASYAHGKQNEFENAFDLLNKYLTLAKSESNKLQEAKAYIEYANNYSWYGDATKEVLYYQKAIEILAGLNDTKTLSVVYANISTTYKNQELLNEALHYANLALTIDKKRGDEKGIAADYLSLASIYSSKKNSDSCIYFNKEALQITRKLNKPFMQVFALINLAKEIKKDNPDTALVLAKEALQLNNNMNYKTGIIKSNITVGEIYIEKKDYDKALEILSTVKNRYENEISKREKLYLLDLIYACYKKKGDYKMAIATDEEWQVVEDSLKTAETRDALLQFSKKELALKAEKDAALKKLKIAEQRSWITALFLGIFALAATGLLYYLHQRKKQLLKNKQIEVLEKEKEFTVVKATLEGQLQERSRISKEIHDDLGASLTSISLLTEVLKKRLDTAQNPEVTKIGATSADMVDKMNEIIWALNTSNDTVNSLVAYLRKFANNFLQDANIKLEFTATAMLEGKELQSMVRRNIYLAAKEALHNIVKHSAAKKVAFNINTTNGVQIEIFDDGKGIDKNKLNSFGNGLINMKKRMEDIGGSFSIENKNGTCITLAY